MDGHTRARLTALDQKAQAERRITHRERQVISCQGLPARVAAVSLGCSVLELLELRDRLRRRGLVPDYPHRAASAQLAMPDLQLGLDLDQGVQPTMHPATQQLLAFFAYSHLPGHLQAISRPFSELAHYMTERLEGPELTVGLRKLLESKDCMVRAALEPEQPCPPAP